MEQSVAKALNSADRVDLLDRGRVACAGELSKLDGPDRFAIYVGAGVVARPARKPTLWT